MLDAKKVEKVIDEVSESLSPTRNLSVPKKPGEEIKKEVKELEEDIKKL